MSELTPVLFRIWPKKESGKVIAIFPTLPGTYDPYTCSSFMHVGQHHAELTTAPYSYRLAVKTRLSKHYIAARRWPRPRVAPARSALSVSRSIS